MFLMRVISLLPFQISFESCFMLISIICLFLCFSVATAINKAERIGEEETRKMKKANIGADDRIPSMVPAFLRPHDEDGGSMSYDYLEAILGA